MKTTHTNTNTFGILEEDLEIIIRNKRTGEEIKTVRFQRRSGDRWDKVVARQLAAVLDINGSSSTRFISFLLVSKDEKNRIFGSYSSLAKNSKISLDTISRLMPKLKKVDFVIKVDTGIHMINPEIIRPGTRWQGAILFEMWNGAKI